MSILSTTPTQPAANESRAVKFIPFTAFLRITPIRGKRFEIVRDMEKIANNVEAVLDDACGGSESVPFDFAKPVAFTPQFGDKTARLTLHGHTCPRYEFTKTPVGLQTVDSDEGIKIGYGTGNASNRIPDTQLDSLAREFKSLIESATGLVMYRLELAGFIYGDKGVAFPL